MTTQDVLLSICVPTFNRVAMLERNVQHHLDAFERLGLAFEIVIVDDCSTDGTAAFIAALDGIPEISAHRRAKNAGFLDNYAFAMRRARGKYAIFLGDDDLLIADTVADYLRRLEADPTLGMIQAPWMLINEREGGAELGPFYRLPREARFARDDHASLLQFIFDFHVFPEFMIIRRDVLARSISSPCPFIFWAFLFTGRALTQADILFMPAPFARVTAISADPRHQQGNKETMFQWDSYRGGVEFLASFTQARSTTGLGQRTALVDHINRFMLDRQKVALRLLIDAGYWVEAYVLHRRMTAYEAVPISPDLLTKVCQLAGVITAVREAIAFASTPVVVDPAIADELLTVVDAADRGRLVRTPLRIDHDVDVARPQAYLRIDPRFPADPRPHDAVFDIGDYLAQFA